MSGKIILRAPSGGSVALKVADTAIDTEVVVHGDSIGGGIGVNQTWQDMTASRASQTDYVNNTGKPIEVSIYAYGDNARKRVSIDVNGLTIAVCDCPSVSGAEYVCCTVIVPDTATYSSHIIGVLTKWSELRGD